MFFTPLSPSTRPPAPAPLPPFADAAAQLVERFGPNCPERCAVRDYHFDCLHRLLMPPHLKFFLWLLFQSNEMSGGGSSASSSGGGGGSSSVSSAAPSFWGLFVKELGLTVEQGEKFRAQLQKILQDDSSEVEAWRLELAMAYLVRLRKCISLVASKAQAQLEGVRAILTPSQFIKFMAWTHRHAASLAGSITGEGEAPK